MEPQVIEFIFLNPNTKPAFGGNFMSGIAFCDTTGLSPVSQQRVETDQFGDAPCLGDAAARAVRRVPVEDLGDAPDPRLDQVLPQKRPEVLPEVFLFLLWVIGDAEGGFAECAQEPGPYGPLVVGAVPFGGAPPVAAPVGRIGGRKGAEAAGCEELLANGPDNGGLLRGVERREGEGDGEDLVRPDGGIQDAVAENVAEAPLGT